MLFKSIFIIFLFHCLKFLSQFYGRWVHFKRRTSRTFKEQNMTIHSPLSEQEVSLSPDILTKPPTGAQQKDFAAWQVLFSIQPHPTRSHLEIQANQLICALARPFPCVQFSLPDQVAVETGPGGKIDAIPVSPGPHDKMVINTRNKRLAVSSLGRRLSQLEQSPDRGVSMSAALLRHAAAIQLIHCPHPLTGSPGAITAEDEAGFASLRLSLWALQAAATLAPYITAGEDYQQTCQGLIRRTTEQGFSLAASENEKMIATIKRRAEEGALNRGLSLSLPYFDDRALEMRTYHFEVIPTGRITFEPGYVMWVAHYEQKNVEQDTRLSEAARTHLQAELLLLEKSFEVPGAARYMRRPARRNRPSPARLSSLRLALNTISMTLMKKIGS
jgi:hypothetical protein